MRDRILTAARSLFIEHGYAGLSMREIAAAVGVSKPALYYHFRDKEGLYLAIVFEFLDEMAVSLKNLPDISARGQLTVLAHYVMSLPFEQRALIRLVSQEIGQLPDETKVKLLEKYQECFLGRIETIIEQGINSGEFRCMSPHLALWALLGLLYPYTFLGASAVHAEAFEEKKIVDQVLSIFFTGIQMT